MKTYIQLFPILLPVLAITCYAQSSLPPAPDLLKEAFTRPPLALDAFEGLAINNNPTLQQANALIKRSAGQAVQAGLWPNPSVGYQGEQIRGGDYGGGEQGAFVQQTVVLGGKLGLRRNIYEQGRREDEIGLTEQRTRIISDIRQRFYSTLAAQQTVSLRKELLAVAADAVETAHQLQNVGQADAPDILQSEVEAEQAGLDYTTAQRLYIQTFRSLAALAGKPDLPLSPLAGDLEHPPQVDPNKIIRQIVRDSPSVKRAQQDTARAEAAVKSARRESIPDLTVRAGIEQNYEHLNGGSNRVVGAQAFASAGITLPLFNRNQGNAAAAAAELERTRREVTRIELSLRQTAQPLLEKYLANQTQAERYRQEMIPRAQRAYQLYLDKYRGMGAAYPQVLVSQRTLFQLRVAYVGVLQELWTEAVALQNYTLSDGLGAVMSSGSSSTELNLPGAAAGGSTE